MNEPVITTYVQYLYKGILDSEGRPVASRDARAAAQKVPEGAFGFRFFDRATVAIAVDGQRVDLASKELRVGPRHYIDAEPLTVADVKALGREYVILLANMRCNRWETVLHCRTGNYEPLMPGDILVSTRAHVGANP
jgi:hypothetical protein